MSNEKTIPVMLYGDLRKRYGRRFDLAVSSPAEAIRALCAIRPGFREYLQEHFMEPFQVLVGDLPKDEKGLHEPIGRNDCIKIVPIVHGAKDGLGQILLGAALIAASIYMPQFAVFAQGGMFAGATAAVAGMGYAMALGGVAQLLANAPQSNGGGLDPRQEDTPSTFGSPTLTIGQGGCVPVCAGLMRIGGHVISSGIDAQAWVPGGFDPAVCLTSDGQRYGNGDTVPWMWAKDES